jgi:hypothetical protein
MLSRIFGPEGEEVTRGERKLHDEEPHNLYSSPNISNVIGSRRIKWTGKVARTYDMRNAYKEYNWET